MEQEESSFTSQCLLDGVKSNYGVGFTEKKWIENEVIQNDYWQKETETDSESRLRSSAAKTDVKSDTILYTYPNLSCRSRR